MVVAAVTVPYLLRAMDVVGAAPHRVVAVWPLVRQGTVLHYTLRNALHALTLPSCVAELHRGVAVGTARGGSRAAHAWLTSCDVHTQTQRGKGAACPQCNKRARLRDVRPIFYPNVLVLDGGRVQKLEQTLTAERRRSSKVCLPPHVLPRW